MAEDVQLDSRDQHAMNTSSLELSSHSASRFAFNHCMLAVIDVCFSSFNKASVTVDTSIILESVHVPV